MKILLFGKNGQVGWELQRSLVPLGEVVALDIMDHAHCGDLTDQVGIARTLQAIQPDIIINAAAYTAVDKAESESDLAYRINAEGPGLLAQQARRLGAWLIHYSTDYVFDGKGKRPWTEADPTSPVNVYGLSKRQGEVLIQQADCKHIILRTSWVYAAQGQNFAKTILRLARERTQLTVIDDQIGAPTGAELLADVTAQIVPRLLEQPELSGLYHVTANGETSWYSYARFVLDFCREHRLPVKAQPDAIIPIQTETFAAAAKRPLNSRLNTEKFRRTFQLHLPPWQTGVTRMLTELLPSR
ncbi:MAG TPA: dTDP-4-dehydrorhamnose reductase [Nitrosomonas halophila]|nr:dTDP-4-dehydrorhamnose reductase [Nitrosomonas halophila]